MPRTVFDVPALNARQQDLEQLAAQPDFWNDQQNAQKQMRRLDEVKAQLQQLAEWRSAIDDAKATLELYELEAMKTCWGKHSRASLNCVRGSIAGNLNGC
jgi:peptide chain release factor 2